MTTFPKIIVVGAGLAGLTAAYRLQKQGYDVHVYEARNRPGGRVLSAKFDESYEELGGKNFNEAGEPLHSLELIHELELDIFQHQMPMTPLYVSEEEKTLFFNIIKRFPRPESFGEIIQSAAKKFQNLQEVIDAVFRDPDLRTIFTRMERNYEGTEPSELDVACFDSLEFLFTLFYKASKEYEEGKTPMYSWLTLKKGNGQLPLALSNSLKGRIYHGQALTTLTYKGKKIALRFNKGQEIEGDVVLLATPCSVFKNIEFGLDGAATNRLSQFQKVQYGSIGKILFPFSPKKKKHEFFMAPKMVSWTDDSYKVRTFYYGGKNGIFGSQKAHFLFAEGLKILQKVFPDISFEPPTLESAKDMQLEHYKGAVYKSWFHDPYSKGGYSNRALGTAAWLSEMEIIKGEKVRTAFRPINNQIFFAGEHSTALDTLGTMEGAVESGERMARLINKTLKLN